MVRCYAGVRTHDKSIFDVVIVNNLEWINERLVMRSEQM